MHKEFNRFLTRNTKKSVIFGHIGIQLVKRKYQLNYHTPRRKHKCDEIF